MSQKNISKALISVYYKDGLDAVVQALHQHGVEIFSTGGTQLYIEQLGIPVTPVEEYTHFPSVFGGRVKTLHPKIFGGILYRRDHEGDEKELEAHQMVNIDLVIVDLYPFEETLANTNDPQEIIEKIDIGGISLIRAAAKNFKDVCIISQKNQYAELVQIIQNQGVNTTLEQRKAWAFEAFKVSSTYDKAIAAWVGQEEEKPLRYGENPHQKASFQGNLKEIFTQHHGKELSYNNLLDVDAAMSLLAEFDECTAIVIKHNNACGLASDPSPLQAWKKALQADPVSAFGGIIAINRPIDEALALEIDSLFFEVAIAPHFDDKALEVFSKKKNRILLQYHQFPKNQKHYRSALNGVLVQERDHHTDTQEDFKYVTGLKPTTNQEDDLVFASKICKHTKSNTIVLAKNKQLLASGTGQTSRVDALNQAINKAKTFGFELEGAVMASDAFFPFPDCVEIADQAGIQAVIQPGGSIKDPLSIDYCNAHQMAMVFTGYRHFKH